MPYSALSSDAMLETPLQSSKFEKLQGKVVNAYWAVVSGFCGLMMSTNLVFAESDDIWSRFSSMMADIYNKLLGVTTIIAVTVVVIALLMRMVNVNSRMAESANSWIKRVVVSWLVINSLGFIIAYLQPLVSGGSYTP